MDSRHNGNGFCDLSRYTVKNVPRVIYYIPNFITEEEELYLIKQIYKAPKPKWTQLLNRRLQNWGGVPHEKGMIPDVIPPWLQVYCDKVEKLGIFKNCKPNHILVNEYSPAQGIMPHTDGPLYYPTVANITLNSYGVLDLYDPIAKEDTVDCSQNSVHMVTSLEERNFGRILMERGSLVIMQEDMYNNYLHGIKEMPVDILDEKVANLNQCPGRQIGDRLFRDSRISLTIRNVPKVLKAKFLLGTKK